METLATRSTNTGSLLDCEGDRARVLTGEEVHEARLALPTTIGLRPGAPVLLIRHDRDWFLIGILEGPRDLLSTEGDLTIRAGGKLQLEAGESLREEAPSIEVTTSSWRVTAEQGLLRAGRFFHWVAERLETLAGSTSTRVEGEARREAGEITETARGTVTIDGEEIDLG
jgi:hypothetical protein